MTFKAANSFEGLGLHARGCEAGSVGCTQELTEALQLSGDLLWAAADLLKFLLPTEHDGGLREFSAKIHDKYVKKKVLKKKDFVMNFNFFMKLSHLFIV